MLCIGKLFTLLLNNRLTTFLEASGALGSEQAGFRRNYSTLDHIFTLKAIIDIYLSRQKKLYCAFIDYSKAFDSINRIKLWKSLIAHGINGKVLNIVVNLYKSAKSCVKSHCGQISQLFPSLIGVRQGDNLSPLLFALYVNDLERELLKKCNGLKLISELSYELLQTEDTVIYCNSITLLYADDTIIMAECKDDLQCALDSLHTYCIEKELSINICKTKIVIFSKGKVRKIPTFHLGSSKVEVVYEYTYLGICFNYNARFTKAEKKIYDQASKAMYSLISKCRSLNLPIDVQLKLFDSLVLPIVTYGCEIWGYSQCALAEKLHIKFCKIILNFKQSTPTCMVLGELGRYPIINYVKCRMVSFWSKLIQKDNSSIAYIMYCLIFNMQKAQNIHSQWLSAVQNVLNNCGFSDIWSAQTCNHLWLKINVKQRLTDQFIQTWCSTVNDSNSCINYRIFKIKFMLEPYLLTLPRKYAVTLTKFRLANSKLPVVVGKYNNINYNDRVCSLCNSNKIGDEFHVLFECSSFDTLRQALLPRYYCRYPNTHKMDKLFNCKSKTKLVNLCKMIEAIAAKFRSSMPP